MKIEETLTTGRGIGTDGASAPPDISVFLPVYDEEPNLRPLHGKLDAAIGELGRTAEIIYVDDGSRDRSLEILRELAQGTRPGPAFPSSATTGKRAPWPPALTPPRGRC